MKTLFPIETRRTFVRWIEKKLGVCPEPEAKYRDWNLQMVQGEVFVGRGPVSPEDADHARERIARKLAVDLVYTGGIQLAEKLKGNEQWLEAKAWVLLKP